MRIIRKKSGYIDAVSEDTIDDIDDLVEENDLDGALLMTNRELVKTPDSLNLCMLKGDILLDMERFDEAALAYDRVLELNPDFPEAWASKSFAFLAMERYEDCLHAVNNADEYGLDDSLTLMVKAESLLGLERHREAMEMIENVLKEEPEHVNALSLRAETLSEMGRHREAIDQLEMLSDMDPWSVDTLVSLSGEHILAKEFSKALKVADRAINLAKSDPMAWGNKAEALYELGRSEEAVECILKAQNMDPTDDETWYQKARIFSQSNPDETLDSLLVAVSINPDNKERAQTEESFSNFQRNERFNNMILTTFTNMKKQRN